MALLERLGTLACSLTAGERAAREARIRALEAHAVEDETTQGVFRLRFPPEPRLAAELAELAVLESSCCRVAVRLELTSDAVAVEVRRGGDAEGPE